VHQQRVALQACQRQLAWGVGIGAERGFGFVFGFVDGGVSRGIDHRVWRNAVQQRLREIRLIQVRLFARGAVFETSRTGR